MIDRSALTRSRAAVLCLIAAAVAYKLINVSGQGTTSLMFVGLPAMLAVIVAMSAPAKTATGTVMKVITLMLLLSGILLVEGAVCILIASPLFFGIGAVIGWMIDHFRAQGRSAMHVSLVIPLVVLSLQGTVPGTSGPRTVTGTAERVVDLSPDEVEASLWRPVGFSRRLPALFRYGRFPRPLSSTMHDGRLVVAFDGAEPAFHKLGMHHHADSTLVLRVVEQVPGRVVFEPESDTTMMAQWATLERSSVEWTQTADGTRVRWTLRMQRRLDPVWYFGPIQTYAAQRAAAYLIDAVVGK